MADLVLTYPGNQFGLMALIKDKPVIANPAAGVDWSYAIPITRFEQLVIGQATFVTSATVANRFPKLIITDGTNTYYTIGNNAAITAGQTWTMTFTTAATGPSQQASAGINQLWLPEVWLSAPWTIGMLTTGIQAGDQWSNINLMFKWFDTPKGMTDTQL